MNRLTRMNRYTRNNKIRDNKKVNNKSNNKLISDMIKIIMI